MSEMAPSAETEASSRFKQVRTGGAAGSGQASKRENLASWHPVPVRLVDTVMPRLKDTELRVLLVVLCQTWGWRTDRTSARKKEASTQANTAKQSARK